DKCDHIGMVSKDQAQQLLTTWTEHAYQGFLKIVVVHHNPVETTSANIEGWRKWMLEAPTLTEDLIARYEADVTGMQGKEHLQHVGDGVQVQLLLHGHHHETGRPHGWLSKGGGATWVLSTGSWGLEAQHLPGAEPASCQLLCLRLQPPNPLVFAHRLVFDS